ncbi:hypothetical protein [Candidatus Odyssella acanthamoebae]|uniref:Uncharacterized protein n=1 Tax=Candidatus Odyssella acanthamoebae TaxID=91604 RepID=A0A077AU49_9PROT|nr:hypothetical protein [Candidatus Paracaedibacter acanthamoebae]AIK95906.1 hypothetical protein ID47_02900 [Candidatus Paracaedibacter acanthamoebae]
MFSLLNLLSKFKKISVHYCIIISLTLLSSLPSGAMDTLSGSTDASSESKEEDYFELVKESEDELLSRGYKIFYENKNSQSNQKLASFYKRDTDIINVTGYSAIKRICLLEKVIKFSLSNSPKWQNDIKIKLLLWTPNEYIYTLCLNPKSGKQKGNGVIWGVKEYSETESNGETYQEIYQYLKIQAKRIKESLITQKKSGEPIKFRYDQKNERYVNGFNLLLDFEVARRRIGGDPFYKTPLLLCIYYLLDNLDNNEILDKCLRGGNYLFFGTEREDFIRKLLPGIRDRYNLRDSESIKTFLITNFSSCRPQTTTTMPSPVQASNVSSDSDADRSKSEGASSDTDSGSGESVDSDLGRSESENESNNTGSETDGSSSEGEKKYAQGKRSTKSKVVILEEEDSSSNRGKKNRKKQESKSSTDDGEEEVEESETTEGSSSDGKEKTVREKRGTKPSNARASKPNISEDNLKIKNNLLQEIEKIKRLEEENQKRNTTAKENKKGK